MALRAHTVAGVVVVLLTGLTDLLDCHDDVASANVLVQDRPVEDIVRALVNPGVYVEAGEGAPLIPVKESLPEGVDFKKASTPEPVWLRIRGQRATVRTGPQPTFYFRNIEAARVGKPGAYSYSATLHGAQVQGDTRLIQWGTFQIDKSRRPVAMPGSKGIDVTIEKISEDLFRLKPAAPLTAGEFVILPARAFAEVGVRLVIEGRYKATTGVYEFGVDPK